MTQQEITKQVISEADYEHIMRQTVEYENRENLIIMAYVIRRESSNEDHEFEYYHSMMLDTHNPNPDLDDDGNPVPETGGRSDILFYVHTDDVAAFALKRLQLDGAPRWWENVVSYNDNSHLYTQEVLDRYKVTW